MQVLLGSAYDLLKERIKRNNAQDASFARLGTRLNKGAYINIRDRI